MTDAHTTTATATSSGMPDEIVRSVEIAASAERVFALISEPGWFINAGDYVEHERTDLGDGLTRVVDPDHGPFEVRTLALEPPHRAVFSWSAGETGAPLGALSTTVEFTVAPYGEGVLLTVRESGFASLPEEAAARRKRFEANSSGWDLELDVARGVCEAAA